jgi:hypothetical protein
MRIASFSAAPFIAFAFSSCGQFEQHKVIPSGGGLFATVAIPETLDAETVCVATEPLEVCSKSEAIYYGYRARRSTIYWTGPTTLLIEQEGGELRKAPPQRAVKVRNETLEVVVRFSP